MSIYHRRVFIKPQKTPPLWKTKILQIQQNQSQSSQPSTQPTNNVILPSSNTKKISDLKAKLNSLTNNQFYSIFMSIITIYTIFAIDIDKSFFDVHASFYFSTIHCIAIFLFVLEILLLSYTKDEYFGKFYFWIDCFSTLTMFLELIWIENLLSSSSDVTVAISFAKVTKASRLSKIGARSSKIMKLIRLVKLMKFFNPQQKNMEQKLGQKKNDQIIEDNNELLQQNNNNQENINNNNKFQFQFQQQQQISNVNIMVPELESFKNIQNSNNLRTNQQRDENIRQDNREENQQIQQNQYQQQDNQQQQQQNQNQNNQQKPDQKPPAYHFFNNFVNNKIQQKAQQQDKHELQQVQQEQQQISQNNSQITFWNYERKSTNFRGHRKEKTGCFNYEIQEEEKNQEENNCQKEQQDQQNKDKENQELSNQNLNKMQNQQQQKLSQQQQYSKLYLPTHKNFHSNLQTHKNLNISLLRQQTITNLNSDKEIQNNQIISQDDKNNIEQIMKLFFTKNLDKFVEQGRNISMKSIETKKEVSISNNNNNLSIDNRFNGNSNRENLSKEEKYNNRNNNNNREYSIVIDGDRNNKQSGFGNKKRRNNIIQTITNSGISSQVTGTQIASIPTKRPQRNSSRLSFIRKKQLLQLTSRNNDQNRQKRNRFNQNNLTNEAPFSNIVEKLQKSIHLPPIERKKINQAQQQMVEKKYQNLLQKIKLEKQPKKVISSENLKVGQVLKQEIQKNIVIMVMGLIMILPIITADTWFDQDSSLSMTANLFIKDFRNLTTVQAQSDLFQSFIQTGLEMATPLQYFDIPINQTCCQFPQDFPQFANKNHFPLQDLRLSEQTIVIDGNMTIIFQKKYLSKISSYLNLSRSFFITLLLIFCSVLFMKDIQNYALNPLQKMSSLINKISQNPFQALKQINQQKNQKIIGINSSQQFLQDEQKKKLFHKVDDLDQKKLQTNILSDLIIKITSLLTIGAGQVGSQIISKNIQQIGNNNPNQNLQINKKNEINQSIASKQNVSYKGQNQLCVYAYIQFRDFQSVSDIFGDQIFTYINKVTEIIHFFTIILGGIPLEYDGRGYLLLWKPSKQIKSLFRRSDLRQKTYKSQKSRLETNGAQSNVYDKHQEQILEEHEKLTKLALLAIHSITKIILELNSLQESKLLYQQLLQKYSVSQNSPNLNGAIFNDMDSQQVKHRKLFYENYQPHLFVSSVHVGESYCGSMGSSYKLQCKSLGYDIAFTRFLTQILRDYNYGISNFISEDIYLLLQDFDDLNKKLNVRKIDELKIKQIRHKDRMKYANLNYMGKKEINNLKIQKVTQTKVYTFDFLGKLQPYNTNQSMLFNLAANGTNPHKLQPFLNPLSQQNQLINHIIALKHQSQTPSNNQLFIKQSCSTLLSKQNISRLKSFQNIDQQNQNQKPQQTLLAYAVRDKWLNQVQSQSVYQILTNLEMQYKDILQARKLFDQNFYQNWNDSLDCYYAKQFVQALNEFKFLHTYNQGFYDYPSKIYIRRIYNINIEELEFQKKLFEDNTDSLDSSNNSQSDNQMNQNGRNENKKGKKHKKWDAMKSIVWRI